LQKKKKLLKQCEPAIAKKPETVIRKNPSTTDAVVFFSYSCSFRTTPIKFRYGPNSCSATFFGWIEASVMATENFSVTVPGSHYHPHNLVLQIAKV
jgi:hypothetical protein